MSGVPRPGRKIPWDEPGFSERMLAEHLSQEHDLASRRSGTIDAHAAFLATLLPAAGGRVLDLGCGPGLYCSRLAALGHECTGIDFSPASIRHAREEAARRGLPCRYLLRDLRTAEFGSGFDLALLLYGELNVFAVAEAVRILGAARRALRDGGTLVLEVQSAEAIERRGRGAPERVRLPAGLFSPRPHVLLTRHAWLPEERAATTRFTVIDEATKRVEVHGECARAYGDGELAAMLSRAGFPDVSSVPSLLGPSGPWQADLEVLLAR